MRSKVALGIVGATGAVGEEALSILAERDFPFSTLRLFASDRSAGKELKCKDTVYTVESVSAENAREKFHGLDVIIFSAGATQARELAPLAAREGCVVIDNSTAFRMDPEVPLIVPEINLHALPGYRVKNIIANPNCTTAIALMALTPLHRERHLQLVTGSTYQAVSGIGAEGMFELKEQQERLVRGKNITPKIFPHQIVDNVIPQVDEFCSSGYTIEEEKMTHEGRKMLGHLNLQTSITCVRVPVPRVHSMALTAYFAYEFRVEDAISLMKRSEGVEWVDNPAEQLYAMPLSASGKDKVQVSRIRRVPGMPNALTLWVVGDQLRKGAALNAVQIAKELFKIMD